MKKLAILFFVSISLLAACDKKGAKDADEPQRKTFTVKSEVIHTPLYFNGTLKPIQLYSVPSLADGAIEKIFFEYGKQINKGDPVVEIDSEKLQQEYEQVLSEFVKSKDKLESSRFNYEGSKVLYEGKYIAKNKLMQDQSGYNNAQLDMYGVQNKLRRAVIGAGIKATEDDFRKLDLHEPKAIQTFLKQHDVSLVIRANQSGIALAAESADKKAGEVRLGQAVKEGDPVISIGDMSGYAIDFSVNEVNINQISVGNKARVTSPALPGVSMEGAVSQIAAQAKDERGVPSFPVRVEVPTPPQEALEKLKIGMSAKIEIDIKTPPMLLVPLKAVTMQKGIRTVQVQTGSGEETQSVPVETGRTTRDKVEITNGLKEGDIVVYYD